MKLTITQRQKLVNIGLIIFYTLVLFIIIFLIFSAQNDKNLFYIEEDSIIMKLGNEYKVLITPKYNYGQNNLDYIWSSSNEMVASVNEEGVINATNLGEATIFIKSKKGNNKRKILVNVLDVDIESISFKGAMGLAIGEEKRLEPLFNNTNSLHATLTYYSHNENVAKVDKYGNVKAVGEGETVITVTATSGVSGDCTIRVAKNKIEATDITLENDNITLNAGESKKLDASISPENVTDKTIKYQSSNTKVATVSIDGVVNAISSGNATITATTSNGKKANCKVVVTEKIYEATSVSLNYSDVSIKVGQKITLVATINPENTSNKNLTWTSSDSSIVSVDKNGVVQSKKIGNATITVKTANGKEAKCNINVLNDTVEVTSIAVTPSNLSLDIGSTYSLGVTITPSNSTYPSITWTSSNSGIVSVDSNGKIKAVSSGTATITATTSNGKTSSCNVTVKQPTIAVTSITMSTTSKTLKPNETYELSVTITPANATDKTIKWTSSNSSIVKVDNGKITSLSPGVATITAEVSGKTATCTVTVTSTYNILFVGNSKTYREDIPLKVNEFAKKDGITLNYTYFTSADKVGGKTLDTIYTAKYSEINKKYDIVILQEQTDAYISSSSGDSANGCEKYLSGVSKIVNTVKSNNPNVKIYLRKVWAQETSSQAIIEKGYACTTKISQQYGLNVINDGPAFYYAKSIGRQVFVSANDSGELGQHQNKHGALLSAACIYAKVFSKDPTASGYNSGLTYDSVMKEIAKNFCGY